MRIFFLVVLASIVGYLGIGALLHAILIGDAFDLYSTWSWGMLLGWPILATIAVVIIALIVGGVILLWMLIEGLAESKNNAKHVANKQSETRN